MPLLQYNHYVNEEKRFYFPVFDVDLVIFVSPCNTQLWFLAFKTGFLALSWSSIVAVYKIDEFFK